MPKNKNKKKSDLGNALIKSKNRKQIKETQYFKDKGVEYRDVNVKAKLESCTDQNPLNEFLY